MLPQIASDIESNAANLVSMMSLQADCLSALDAKLGHVKFQLRLVKETHATVELNKLRAPVTQHAARPVSEVRPRELAT
jgi:hypothetical protein